jgi:carboxyl-terminal processing protease
MRKQLRISGTVALGALGAAALLSGPLQLPSFAGPTYPELEHFSTVVDLVKKHYVEDVSDKDLMEGAIRGMLDTLDPHTSYLPPDLYKEVQQDTKGEFEGLGIEITKRDGFVTVVSPIEGTPASEAGIRAQDQIIAVCPDAKEESCKSTHDMSLVEAMKLMRGKRDSLVMIQVQREGWQTPKPFVIKRAAIKVPSVQVFMVEPDLPYVALSQFQEKTSEDLEAALGRIEMPASGALKGLILDLRNNPGGLLEQAVEVVDLFIAEGLIVFAEGRGGSNRSDWHAERSGREPDYPIVVLINGGSASASEIVAGALQDHDRALVIGTESFGKGSVQTIIGLPNKAGLRLTTALYYLPSGRSIQEVRVKPDVRVEPLGEAEVEALKEAEKKTSLGEEHLQGHFKPGGASAGEAAPKTAAADLPKDERERRFQENLKYDRQLQRAVDLLKSWTIFSKLHEGESS